ncbi:UDP-4-amino-4,6-dideoxy-N-acetyl-beta-L-altrosamine transaminase [Polaromonas sp. A23]|uniref:UDP-4-amino-4, 6-dideoxy-N-acetyl-beta-L-altrosamine transaminase n=1 Tax=Polaromonas sp. A23 TaxID=1944133 RepID=UPI001C2C48BC|nr:UDP-4-amino-4,6-dideoxy-N-acetyl-beta-L-altrosamine transaminase [Polaromonas sp. A23]
MNLIPYGRQDIDDADIAAVAEVLRSDFLTQGPAVPRFEQAIASYCGVGHAVAANSATSSLHVACLALGVGKGSIVWTTPITFVASANCALYCGASVDFVDIDPVTYNMSVDRLEEKLLAAKKSGSLPSVVIPVHLCGQPCDMAGIHALSLEYGFRVIEDASHAIGGTYRNEPVGNCRYSDITVFSFHPVKIITTGEGGMATTNDPELAKRMRMLGSHGITRDAREMTREPDGPWYYEQVELGFNYRMTDIQAALGVSQMRRLDEFVSRRHAIAGRYDESLRNVNVTAPWQHPDGYSGLHLYVVRLHSNMQGSIHRKIFDEMRATGIGVNLHYIPVHMQPYYQKIGFNAGDFPAAEQYYETAISLPMFPALTEAQQDTVVSTLRKLVNQQEVKIPS